MPMVLAPVMGHVASERHTVAVVILHVLLPVGFINVTSNLVTVIVAARPFFGVGVTVLS